MVHGQGMFCVAGAFVPSEGAHGIHAEWRGHNSEWIRCRLFEWKCNKSRVAFAAESERHSVRLDGSADRDANPRFGKILSRE